MVFKTSTLSGKSKWLKLFSCNVVETCRWNSAAPVPLFHLSDQFISRKLSSDNQDQALDDILWAVHVQETTNHNRQTARIHLETHILTINLICLFLWYKYNRHEAFKHFFAESYLLNIDLNVLLQVVAIQVEDQVVDKVKTVTDDDERQLVGEFGFLSSHTEMGKRSSSVSQTQPTHIYEPQNINQPRCNRFHLTFIVYIFILLLI